MPSQNGENFVLIALLLAGVGLWFILNYPKKSPQKQSGKKYGNTRKIFNHTNFQVTGIRYDNTVIGPIKPGKSIIEDLGDGTIIWTIGSRTIAQSGYAGYAERNGANEIHLGNVFGRYYYIDQSSSTALIDGPKIMTIENLSDRTLRLDGIPPVRARSSATYRGPIGTGVALGTKFVDLDGIFPEYVMDKPITRLYYEMVSETGSEPRELFIIDSYGGGVPEEAWYTTKIMEPGGYFL